MEIKDYDDTDVCCPHYPNVIKVYDTTCPYCGNEIELDDTILESEAEEYKKKSGCAVVYLTSATVSLCVLAWWFGWF